MLRRLTVPVAIGLALTLAASGCAAHDSTGRLSVTVPRDAGTAPVEVEVVIDATNQMSEHQRVYPGTTADFAGVPLGAVTVRAGKLCRAHAEVTDGPAERVTLAAPPCAS